MEKRNEFLDIIKGIAIIFVIIGHCIQYGSGSQFYLQELYFSNSLFKFIYSFHMPIFMIISGYLYYFTIKKYSTKTIIKSRANNLLIPIFTFTIIKYIIVKPYMNNGYIAYVIQFLFNCVFNLWFLWAVLFCSLGVLVINKLYKDKIIIYCLIFIISFFVPDVFFLNLYKFMYPYFVAGYLINKYNKTQDIKGIICNKNYFFITTIIYFILLAFYNNDSYIYTTGHCILNGNIIYLLLNNIYRMVIGFVGSLFVTMILYFAYKKINLKHISYIGKKSLGIYALSDIIFVYILPIITASIQKFNILYTFIETVIILSFCLGMVWILEKNQYTKYIFLGIKKYQKENEEKNNYLKDTTKQLLNVSNNY